MPTHRTARMFLTFIFTELIAGNILPLFFTSKTTMFYVYSNCNEQSSVSSVTWKVALVTVSVLFKMRGESSIYKSSEDE